MWKLWLVAPAAVFATWGCLDPGCMRNSECSYGLECRANKCQKPLPPAAATPIAGQSGQCYAYWCPYVQDGGQINYGGSGGHAAVNTSTRYKDGGTATDTNTGAGGTDTSSSSQAGTGADDTGASGAGGSM